MFNMDSVTLYHASGGGRRAADSQRHFIPVWSGIGAASAFPGKTLKCANNEPAIVN
jgi:hypothetical protein